MNSNLRAYKMTQIPLMLELILISLLSKLI